MLSKLFDIQLLKFLIVGIINTIIGVGTQLIFYNFFQMGYWGSSALSYTIASIISFFLNKNFTFNNKSSTLHTAVKFAITIVICYFIAYKLAKTFVFNILKIIKINIPINIAEQVAMLTGMCIFTCLNYVAQKYFAFKE